MNDINDEKIMRILDNFDFEKVYNYMHFTGETWKGKIPTVQALRDFVLINLNDLKHHPSGLVSVSSGGFYFLKRPVCGKTEYLVIYSLEKGES